MPEQSAPVDEILCRWAEKKWKLSGVTQVTFEPAAHGPYSDVTPDLDQYMAVEVTTANGVEEREVPDYYTTDLIREILAFAVTEDETDAR